MEARGAEAGDEAADGCKAFSVGEGAVGVVGVDVDLNDFSVLVGDGVGRFGGWRYVLVFLCRRCSGRRSRLGGLRLGGGDAICLSQGMVQWVDW